MHPLAPTYIWGFYAEGNVQKSVAFSDLTTKVITIQMQNMPIYCIIDAMKGALYER